ncbi:MAG: ribosomal rRNA E-loop binding protein Ctc/L25/TL5, large subunit ribosomal protein [Candidatus Taylorbacteria bacterium]|nr:ribosomal rRNA E-loop binding protein Ctc/L25/TL5, large subunit ribosomal protein [Candidatus Taylorbacteria bacterium]
MTSIEIKSRDSKENVAELRAKGFTPAVFYGAKETTTSITVSTKELEKAWKTVGESSIITLKSENGDHDALIHAVDIDGVTGKIKHADFYVIEKGKKVTVHVPVEFEGIAPAVKDLGGVLVKVLHELEIEAMPKDLPHNLIADISIITDFDVHLYANQIKLPAGVTLLTHGEEAVAKVARPKEEKEEDSAPIDLSAIEVEKKGKKDEEGEGAAEEK